MPAPFLLGLTGNIACGKSTVGRLLAERHGAEYLDADAVVHALYAPGTPESARIAERFGGRVLRADGTIDRRALGDLVMANQAALRDLEAILVPTVRRQIEQRIQASTAAVLVVDAIKLIESGLADRCAAVWVVTCDRADQLRRLIYGRGLTEAQAAARVDAQSPAAEKLKRATAIIDNRGDLADLERQVRQAWARLPLLTPPPAATDN